MGPWTSEYLIGKYRTIFNGGYIVICNGGSSSPCNFTENISNGVHSLGAVSGTNYGINNGGQGGEILVHYKQKCN